MSNLSITTINRKILTVCTFIILFLQSSILFSEDKEILEIRKYYQSVQKDLK